VISDDAKIYIPSYDEQAEEVGGVSSSQFITGSGEVIGVKTEGKVNINTASVTELDGLWGIGEKRA
jgi:DNA uptake protein ComE-like DNA-binding protein